MKSLKYFVIFCNNDVLLLQAEIAMKREADGDMGSAHKRSRRGDEEVRLLIPSKVSTLFCIIYLLSTRYITFYYVLKISIYYFFININDC